MVTLSENFEIVIDKATTHAVIHNKSNGFGIIK